MKQIPLTQGQFALVDNEDFEFLMQWNWFAFWDGNTKQFRAARSQWVYKRHANIPILIHRQILNFPKGWVDHANQNALDNQKSNLRIATPSQSACNKHVYRNNLSGLKGVRFHYRKWEARIQIDHKPHFLGSFPSALEAATAYDRAALELHGEFARLNFPQLQNI